MRSEKLLIEASLPGERLDSFLPKEFPEISRGAFQRLIQEGRVLVNGRKVKPTHAPRAGEVVTIEFPDPRPDLSLPEEMPLEIIYEDPDLLVINKPPGIVVHPSAGHERHTLVNALLHHCKGQLSGIGGVARPGIVHRLDKDTSGCLIVAKNDSAHSGLAAQFHDRLTEKTYQAIVCGSPKNAQGEIHANIVRHPSHRKRMAVTGKGEGREAWTSYRVLSQSKEAAHVEAQLHTGRTHQIRVHFQFLGCPVVGDSTYGSRQNDRLMERTGYSAPRQMLHAFRLALTHPATGRKLEFVAGLPADFTEALARLAG